jgi:hypothetical protein
MVLPPQETERFYRIWFPLLNYVNAERRLLPSFPAAPGEATVAPADAAVLRDALWEDDALRERFLADNPAELPPADLALVASWRHRLAGRFFIERYLKRHTIFLSESTPVRAFGVLGLVAPVEEIVGPYLPIYVQAVLLPFEGRIVYDSLLAPYAIAFGPGIRGDLKEAYRDAQEREGVITTLEPEAVSAGPEAVRSGVSARNARVLTAFRKDLARRGLSPAMVEQHSRAVEAFARTHLLGQEPPRGLLDLSREDLRGYLSAGGATANPVSFRRFVRFLAATGRLDPGRAAELSDALKGA